MFTDWWSLWIARDGKFGRRQTRLLCGEPITRTGTVSKGTLDALRAEPAYSSMKGGEKSDLGKDVVMADIKGWLEARLPAA
jgi:hypothetical protein